MKRVESIYLQKEHLEEILERALSSEVEICGFLLGHFEGKDNTTFAIVEEIKFIKNVLESSSEFRMDTAQMIDALEYAETKGLEVVGILHSHVECPPKPSKRDIDGMKLWPVVWLIVSKDGSYGAYVLERNCPSSVRITVQDKTQRNGKSQRI